MKKILTLAVLALLLAACKTAEKPSPILTIEGGQVQGVATDIAGVTAYKGIPYAAPPLGDLRWKAPQPVVPWDGVKVCDRFGHPSFQAVHYPCLDHRSRQDGRQAPGRLLDPWWRLP